MKITLAIDNLALGNLISEHGLSILVESADASALFDAGQTVAIIENLHLLEIDISKIRAVAVSHGHYDHTGGLRKVMSQATHARCYAHADCFRAKYALSDQGIRYIGVPATGTVSDRVISYNRNSVEILPGMILSGEISIRSGIRHINPRFLVEAEAGLHRDGFEDEQCMVVKGNSGLAVLLGCSHRGVENNLLAAMDIAGTDEISLVVGGLHLGDANEERLDSVAGFLASKPIQEIACCHCTGQKAIEYLQDRVGPRVIQARAGMSWRL